MIPYNQNLKQEARKMRNNPTLAEKLMWNILKNDFKNFVFLRQKPLDNFIADFYCFSLRLIIEVDGEIHFFQKEKDKERDALFLERHKLQTLRFTNDDVIYNPNKVVESISNFIRNVESQNFQ